MRAPNGSRKCRTCGALYAVSSRDSWRCPTCAEGKRTIDRGTTAPYNLRASVARYVAESGCDLYDAWALALVSIWRATPS